MCFLAFCLAACTYENVELRRIESVEIESLDKSGISFSARLSMTNPNSYKVSITETDADLFLDGRRAGKAKLRECLVIPAKFDSSITAKVRTDFEGGSLRLIPIILGAAVNKKVDLRAQGHLRAKSFLVGKKFDFDYSHEAELRQ